MYDHNQTLVPDAFMALYVRHGRVTAPREQVEARHEVSETLALHIAERLSAAVPGNDHAAQRDALRCVRASLWAEPAQVTIAEVGWVIRRVIELCDWPIEWNDAPPGLVA